MKQRIVVPAVAGMALVAVVGAAAAQAMPTQSSSQAVDRAVSAARAHGKAFGLDADQALTVRSTSVDPDGTSHVRFDRTFKGLPVVGGDFVVHTDARGSWKGVNAASNAVRVDSTKPVVAPQAAAADAAGAVDFTVSTSSPTLAVYAME